MELLQNPVQLEPLHWNSMAEVHSCFIDPARAMHCPQLWHRFMGWPMNVIVCTKCLREVLVQCTCQDFGPFSSFVFFFEHLQNKQEGVGCWGEGPYSECVTGVTHLFFNKCLLTGRMYMVCNQRYFKETATFSQMHYHLIAFMFYGLPVTPWNLHL